MLIGLTAQRPCAGSGRALPCTRPYAGSGRALPCTRPYAGSAKGARPPLWTPAMLRIACAACGRGKGQLSQNDKHIMFCGNNGSPCADGVSVKVSAMARNVWRRCARRFAASDGFLRSGNASCYSNLRGIVIFKIGGGERRAKGALRQIRAVRADLMFCRDFAVRYQWFGREPSPPAGG